MKKYITPDFDVTIFEIENVIAAVVSSAVGEDNGDDGNGDWSDWA